MINNKNIFFRGVKDGLPIGLGYLSVSIAFGALCISSGQPIWAPIITSISNFTGIGQIAGINLIASHASLLEVAFTLLVINLRYILMSLSLTQKISPKMSTWKRMLIAFGVTDENFAVAFSQKDEYLPSIYFAGLISSSYSGWVVGTILGAFLGKIIPEILASALGITLYTMFIAIIVPEAKSSKPILFTSLIAVAISCLLYYLLPSLSSGWTIIIAGVVSALIMSFVSPTKEKDDENVANKEVNV